MTPPRAPCCVCALPSDLSQTSAHFAGVWRFCGRCGEAFHSTENLAHLAAVGRVARNTLGTSGTLEQWKAIERWIFNRRAQLPPPGSATPATSPAPPSDAGQASPPASSSPSDGGGRGGVA